MKKLGMLLMLFSLCVFTVGCSGDTATETVDDAVTEVDGDGDTIEADTVETTEEAGG